MATSVVCSVVHLAQQPPPVYIPSERMALPSPMPGKRPLVHRTSRDSHGCLRLHRPAFQPFQLKPWVKESEADEEMKQSMAVVGPNITVMKTLSNFQRSVTAPPSIVSSMEQRRNEEKVVPRTAHSTSSFPDHPSSTKRSMSTFPARPPISKEKQIPGRLFLKPRLVEEQKFKEELSKRMKPSRKTSNHHSVSASHKSDALHLMGIFNSLPSVSRMDRQHSPAFNQRIARTRQQLHSKDRSELRSDVFAISFKQELDSTAYDPGSELHSDYYSIKRLKMPMARLGRPVETSAEDFAIVLQGHRKHLHKKFFLDEEFANSLLEPTEQNNSSRDSLTRRTMEDEGESSHSETPKTGSQAPGQAEADGAEEEQDTVSQPLKPTPEQKADTLPALT